MKVKLIILVLVFLLSIVSCNREKNNQNNFEDIEAPVYKSYIIGKGIYEKKKIPFIEINPSKGEYFKVLEYNGQIQAIKCDNGDIENLEYIDGYDAYDYKEPDYYDKIKKTTNIQLYILDGEEWKPSTKWSVGCWGITEFCHDSNGNLYAHYLDRASNECIDGSKLYKLNQDGSVETTILDNKDITSIRKPYEGDTDGWTGVVESRAYAYSLQMTENDDVAITYYVPGLPPQLILYDAYTGKKVFETDYPGSDLEKYIIHNEDLIYYTSPQTSKLAPSLNTSNLKTGSFIRKSYFGEESEWNPLDVLRLRICLGKEEDIYLCTPNGIYGGKINQEDKYDLLMPASELGYEESDFVSFFSIGWERDFYLLYGFSDENMNIYHLYHYTLKE